MNNEIKKRFLENHPSPPSEWLAAAPADEIGRRSFLRFLSLGASGAILGGAFGCGGSAMAANSPAITRASALVDDQRFWDSIKQSFIISTPEIVLNVDGGAVIPASALSAMQRNRKGNGDKLAAAGGFTTLLSQRTAIGNILGTHPDDVALVNSATEAIVQALIGLSWSRDDVIFYTDHEHPNVIAAINSLKFLYKIVPVVIPLPTAPSISAAEMASAIEAHVARHRPAKRTLGALVWSSPTYQTGAMLPIARMAAIAKKYDLISVCDAAHLMGMAAIDFSALDIDFLATCGHKWQCGPKLTAALLRNARLSGKWSMNRTTNTDATAGPTRSFGAQVSYTTIASTAKFDSLIASCALWDKIGRGKIEAYALSLGAYLKSRIEQVWGVSSLRSPLSDPELLSGITSFDPFIDSPLARQANAHRRFVDRLRRDHGFVVRVVALPSNGPSDSAVRVATPLWVQHGDIDRLVGAMYSLSKEMRRY